MANSSPSCPGQRWESIELWFLSTVSLFLKLHPFFLTFWSFGPLVLGVSVARLQKVQWPAGPLDLKIQWPDGKIQWPWHPGTRLASTLLISTSYRCSLFPFLGVFSRLSWPHMAEVWAGSMMEWGMWSMMEWGMWNMMEWGMGWNGSTLLVKPLCFYDYDAVFLPIVEAERFSILHTSSFAWALPSESRTGWFYHMSSVLARASLFCNQRSDPYFRIRIRVSSESQFLNTVRGWLPRRM